MASLLQRRFQCFYCGVRSSRPTKGPVREWKCPECQAVNHLDEKGEITDPPVADTSSNTRPTQYALPLPRADSEAPLESSPGSALFCSTCLKNQHLLTQTLAAYLPPPSDPDYEAYEASYPTYRKSLEERYPQVCENCEPRIRERIRQAGYAAKADHLRRMMERSKNGRSRRNTGALRWKRLVVLLGAMAYWVSLAGQLAWNAVGAVSKGYLSAGFELDTSSVFPAFRWCLSSMRSAAVPNECRTVMQPYAGFALVLGALVVWWNPMLVYKAQGRPGRIKGLREYYRIQIVVLVTRFAAWTFLQDDMITNLNPSLAPTIHALVGVFIIVAIIGSRSVIKFDMNSIVAWQDHVEPLIQKRQRNAEMQLPTPADSQERGSNAGFTSERFPISSLAGPRQPRPEPRPPAPLPPRDDTFDDSDAMDWTPSQETTFQPNVNPTPPLSQSQPTSSLFHGQLPPAPAPPAWQLRNRNAEPATKPAQSNPNPFLNNPSCRPTPHGNATEHSERSEVIMAPPKFFPPSDLRADTGLESLFDRTFSLADEPNEVRRKQGFGSEERAVMAPPGRRTPYVLKCGLLSATLVMLTAMQTSSLPRNTIETTVLATCFVIAGFSLLESLMKPMAFWNTIDFIFPVLELVACVYLALLRSRGIYSQIQFDRIGQGLAAFMLVQELLVLRGVLANTAEPTGTTPTTEAQQSRKPPGDSALHRSTQPTLGSLSLGSSSPPRPLGRPGVPNSNSFGNHGTSTSSHVPPFKPNQQPSSFSAANTIDRSFPQSPALSRNNNTNFQSHLNAGPSISHTPQQPMQYPPPFSSFSRPPADPPLSFSSFGSALPEKILSPASAASTTEYASSNTSEPPSPQHQARPFSPISTRSRRSARSPSITGLTLDDGPSNRAAMSRYSLRSRR